jgi:hypothetical protein
MAFNPFHGFRKYRKMMFAVLTILCMFVFVLSSGMGGKGDFFGRDWFGGSRYPAVAKIDGRTVDTQEMRTISNQRRLANDFIEATLSQSHFTVIKSLQTHLEDIPQIVREPISRAIGAKFNSLFQPRALGPQYVQMIPSYQQAVRLGITLLERDKKSAEADSLRRFEQIMERDKSRVDYYGDLYFGGSLRSGQDLIDFLVWKWAADKHNIELTTEAVQEMMREEVGSDADEAAKTAEKSLRERYKGVTAAGLLSALNDEFRVRLVKTAILGETSKKPTLIGAYVTPYEFYKHFRDVRTLIRVNLLPLKSDAYMNQVTDKPSEAELRELFKKHRNDEPIPFMERPGFKEPKKAKIEWIGFKGDEPLVKKAALADSAKKSALAEAVQKAVMAPPGESAAALWGRLGALAVVNDPKLIEKRTDEKYKQYVNRERSTYTWLYADPISVTIHDSSVLQPRVIAAGMASALGSAATGGKALSIRAAMNSQAAVQEMRERIRFGLFPLALAPQGAAPLLGLSDMIMPQPLPKAAVQARLNEEVTDAIYSDFYRSEVEEFQKTLAEKTKDMKKPEAKEAARKFIDEFIKKYGLAHGGSAEFRDQYHMVNDPGLKPLREQFTKEFATQDPTGISFGGQFLDENQQQTDPAAHSGFQAKWIGATMPYSISAKPQDHFYLAWKSEEAAPKVRDFAEAKADVEAAWKRIKARELAAKAAADLQKQLRDKTVNNLASLKDFAAQRKIDLIEIGPIALRQESPAGMGGGMSTYAPPQTPRDKVPFGTGDFCLKLMELRDKPIGETMVLTDIPKDTDYVAVLTERQEPSDAEFQRIYAHSGFDPRGGDPLIYEFDQQERFKARNEIIKQIRADAKVTIVDEEELKRFAEKGSSEE